MQVTVLDCRTTPRGGLYVKLRLPSFGLILHDVRIRSPGGHLRVELPRRPVVDDSGQHKRGARDGDLLYVPAVSFDSRETGEAFTRAVLSAVRAAYPVALATIQSATGSVRHPTPSTIPTQPPSAAQPTTRSLQ